MTGRAAKTIAWALMALPAAAMAVAAARGDALAMDLLRPSGEWSARLLVLALLPGPLAAWFGTGRFLRGWLGLRRNLGVAAFAYGVLHLGFYAADMGALAAMVDELALPAIWTGWLAILALAIPAAISFDRAMRRLGSRWKTLQALVYLAALATLAHWLLLEWNWQPAAVHFLPLAIAWPARLLSRHRRRPKLQGA